MKILTWLGVGLLLFLAVSFGLYMLQVGKVIELSEPVTVEIEDNSGTEGALVALWDAGVLPSKWGFIAHLLLTGQRTDIKSGTYEFSDSVTLDSVLGIITQNKTQKDELEITILEGWTNEDIATYLSEAGVVDYEEFIKIGETKHTQTILPDNKYDFLIGKPLSVGLQGFLFPDTYRIFEGETEIGIVEKMLDNFKSKFTPEMIEDVAKLGKTNYEIVTLASIVEKEVYDFEDKQKVAGIFWKRMDNGMRIQSDATINYITKKNTTTPNAADLNAESAYNTYRNDGLPPTPINNPGIDTIKAVIYPISTEYWYFLTTPDGKVLYSKTYEEHLEKRSQYYD
ncbi:MAG: endolytic transglycosylase MltG [bacterium]|nr:endolytic transglycosylase MltG [bacterium]